MNRLAPWLFAALIYALSGLYMQGDDLPAAQAAADDLNDATAAAMVAWKDPK